MQNLTNKNLNAAGSLSFPVAPKAAWKQNAPAYGVVGNHGDDVDVWPIAVSSCYPTTRCVFPDTVRPRSRPCTCRRQQQSPVIYRNNQGSRENWISIPISTPYPQKKTCENPHRIPIITHRTGEIHVSFPFMRIVFPCVIYCTFVLHNAALRNKIVFYMYKLNDDGPKTCKVSKFPSYSSLPPTPRCAPSGYAYGPTLHQWPRFVNFRHNLAMWPVTGDPIGTASLPFTLTRLYVAMELAGTCLQMVAVRGTAAAPSRPALLTH